MRITPGVLRAHADKGTGLSHLCVETRTFPPWNGTPIGNGDFSPFLFLNEIFAAVANALTGARALELARRARVAEPQTSTTFAES